jgi:ubiquinone/menaquinone biosynthesis C-methylase UbiE
MTTQQVDQVSRYTFSNADEQGPHQLKILAGILDEHSTAVLTNAGIDYGWTCLDVGPGGGSITHWMADQVGPNGHVTALDLNPQHVQPGDNITIQRADVRTIDLPADHYDLIHTRLVLVHLAERHAVLDRLVPALKPGGLLVVTDWDATWRDWLLHAPSPAAADAFDAFQNALTAELEAHGADLAFARHVPLAMQAAGLSKVDTVGYNRLWRGGEPGCLLHASNAIQLRERLLHWGMTAEQLQVLQQAMHDPTTLAYGYSTFTTIGHRPE